MLTSGDVFARLNNEALSFIAVEPGGLSWALVIQHVGIWDEAVSLDSINRDAKNTTGNDHSNFRVLLEGKLLVFGHLLANKVVIYFDILNLLVDLVQEWTTLEPHFLILAEEYGEIAQTFWQNVKVFSEWWWILLPLLQKICAKERVFWRDKSLSKALLIHQLTNWGLEGHLQGDNEG